MITIPVAVNNDFFEKQLSLFWFNHQRVYGADASKNCFPIVVLQYKDNLNFCSNAPYKFVNDWSCYFVNRKYHGGLSPLNMQIGLLEILDNFDKDDILELIDCDMFHIKKSPIIPIKDDEFVVCDIYEDWHLKSNSNYKYIIQNFLKENYSKYNGGFVPITGKAKTFKKILNDWINFHIKVFDSVKNHQLQWWAGMYSFQIACANNNIKMTSMDLCYLPNINELNDNHYICHYSCDPIFNKGKMLGDIRNFDSSNFPKNLFYDSVKGWYDSCIGKEK